MSDDIDFIPLKNLPNTGLTAYVLEEWKPGDHAPANNVLIRALDMLDTVIIIGRDKDGELYFGANHDEIGDIINDVTAFRLFLKDYE